MRLDRVVGTVHVYTMKSANRLVLGAYATLIAACGAAESGQLPAVPGANDLSIVGVWGPRDPSAGQCDFDRPDFEAAENVFIRLPDGEMLPNRSRSLPIRVERSSGSAGAPARQLRLLEARVRWRCREDENPYRHDWWPDQGLDPEEWAYLPMELPGWPRPFCGPDIDAVETLSLKTATLSLEPGEAGTVWVEIIAPSTRRALAEYEELAGLAGECMALCPSDRPCRLEEPLMDFNYPHCARFIERHQEFLGATKPTPVSIGAAMFYWSKTARVLLSHAALTLEFEDASGFTYKVQEELPIHLVFSLHHIRHEPKGSYECYERDF